MDNLFVKMPRMRIGALIGKQGKTKKELEELSDCNIFVDSATGDVEISSEKANPITFYRLEQVIKAIARGFSPEHAKYLLDESFILNIINLHDLGIHTSKTLQTRKARVIGSQGAIRQFIEDSLDCFIAIQGKTISIIGNIENIRIAHEAILKLLKGATISRIKKYINRAKTNIDQISNTESNNINFDNEQERDILD